MTEVLDLIERCRQLQIEHDRRIPVQLELKEDMVREFVIVAKNETGEVVAVVNAVDPLNPQITQEELESRGLKTERHVVLNLDEVF